VTWRRGERSGVKKYIKKKQNSSERMTSSEGVPLSP
jgi:hypothetical protein